MKKILLVGDGGIPSGFERVVRNIGSYLVRTGQFEVVQRGIGYMAETAGQVPDYPYEIKPASGQREDGLFSPDAVATWVAEDRPDALLMVQDLWNQWTFLHDVPRELPTIGYFPVDTPNMKWSFATAAAALTVPIPYTRFGAQETALGLRDAVDVLLDGYRAQGITLDTPADYLLLPRGKKELCIRADRLAQRQNPEAMPPIGHGIDASAFVPGDRKAARRAWGLPEDAFVVLSVNTNQFRKRQDVTIRAFAEVAQDHPNALLVLHCMGGDQSGWDLGQLARLYGITNKMICTHWAVPTVTDEQLVLLYQSADVHMNTSGGEGWGLTIAESALCGVPQLVPDWSATRELWKDAAMLLPVTDYRFETKSLNTAHAVVSARDAALRLRYLAKNEEVRHGYGQLCRERALTFPTWEAVGEQFVQRIQQALSDDAPTRMPLADISAARRGELRSELLAF